MKKLVNGELVNLTANEIYARQDEDALSLQQQLSEHLPKYRRKRVNEGLTINGFSIQTDLETRTNLLGAKELGTDIKWKTPNGFVDLTAAQIAAIATAVGQHVQKCFDVEAALDPADYDTIQDLETAFDAAYTGE